MYYEVILYDEKWTEKICRFTTLKEAEEYIAKTSGWSHYSIVKCQQIKLV